MHYDWLDLGGGINSQKKKIAGLVFLKKRSQTVSESGGDFPALFFYAYLPSKQGLAVFELRHGQLKTQIFELVDLSVICVSQRQHFYLRSSESKVFRLDLETWVCEESAQISKIWRDVSGSGSGEMEVSGPCGLMPFEELGLVLFLGGQRRSLSCYSLIRQGVLRRIEFETEVECLDVFFSKSNQEPLVESRALLFSCKINLMSLDSIIE